MIRAPGSLLGISGRKADMRKTPAVAVIGLAGFLGAAACGAHVQVTPVPAPPAAPMNNTMARDIANLTVGKGTAGLGALADGDGQATAAYCNPGTVSRPPHASTPASVSCRIRYSDGSVWQQTITIAFDSHGRPIAGRANRETEIVPPGAGDGPITRIRCAPVCPN
jgi:hypothetical protein